MLALSPPLFSTTYGWPSEDLIAQNVPHECIEANSYNSLLDFHKYDQSKHDFVRENSFSSGGGEKSGTGDDMMVSKKINHNASERDRRKRVNHLYAFLRSLLPMSSDQKKKVSIPGTVSRALKYIPELQKEVENLRKKKEKLSSYSPSTSNMRPEHLGIKKRSAEDAIIKTKSSFVSSVSSLGEKEAVIQLISSTYDMSKNKEISNLSKVLEYIEQEEVELVLINATTFKCFGEGRLLSTLHLQVQGDYKIESEKLKEKLRGFHQ